MSDTFDHEGDAWASRDFLDDEYQESGPARPSTYDPLYYHHRLDFKRLVGATEKAVKIELLDGREMWLARKVCRRWTEGSVYVHTITLKKALAGAQKPAGLHDLPDMDDLICDGSSSD